MAISQGHIVPSALVTTSAATNLETSFVDPPLLPFTTNAGDNGGEDILKSILEQTNRDESNNNNNNKIEVNYLATPLLYDQEYEVVGNGNHGVTICQQIEHKSCSNTETSKEVMIDSTIFSQDEICSPVIAKMNPTTSQTNNVQDYNLPIPENFKPEIFVIFFISIYQSI